MRFKLTSSCGAYEIPFRAVPPPQPQTFGEELPDAPDGEQPGPSRRKRQPSMSETMPLYTLCKEDLESMDKEVSQLRPGAHGGARAGAEVSQPRPGAHGGACAGAAELRCAGGGRARILHLCSRV